MQNPLERTAETEPVATESATSKKRKRTFDPRRKERDCTIFVRNYRQREPTNPPRRPLSL
ncbi:MAG: hypothetical protein NVS2B5_27970 [Beijerinckiaceae bacterium]